jgi:integrase
MNTGGHVTDVCRRCVPSPQLTVNGPLTETRSSDTSIGLMQTSNKPKTSEPSKTARYYARFPSLTGGKGKHATFGIYMRHERSDGSTTNESVHREEVETINEQFRKKVIDRATAKKNVKALVRKLNREIGVLHDIDVFNHDNEKVLQDYWDRKYRTRQLVDKRNAYNAISRAVKALGNISLLSASQDELQNRINEALTGNNQRAAVNRINSLLQHIGRDFELDKFKPEYPSVKHLTWDEFQILLEQIPHDDLRVFAEVCFYTGMRESEALAGSENTFRLSEQPPRVYVHKQIRAARRQMDGSMSKKQLGVPKSKKRWAYIFEEGLPAVEKWLKIYKNFNLAPSHASKLLRQAAMRAFPENRDKWLAFNGLRHSYAKSLYEMGLPTSHVAKHLGNTERVCEQYYVGWEHTPASMQFTHQLVVNNKHRLKG